MGSLLPVHGFVLAGGQSSRMGRDKALLPFRGRPMVEIAVEKLRGFCAAVSVCGNRDDLEVFAPVVHESRLNTGPAAGIEAGLQACSQLWAMFMPVDVPMVPAALLKRWASAVVARAAAGCRASFLTVAGHEQPAFCLLHRHALPVIVRAVDEGERKLRNLLKTVEAEPEFGWLWVCSVEELVADLLHPEYPGVQVENWFHNVNTPDELLLAEAGAGPE